ASTSAIRSRIRKKSDGPDFCKSGYYYESPATCVFCSGVAQRHEVLSQPLSSSAHARQHRSQRYSQRIGRLLMCQFAHHYQQQRLTQFTRKLRECMLHLIREFIRGRVHGSNRHFQRSISDEDHSPASTPPTIDHSPPQDRSQPCSLTAPAGKIL